MGTSPTGTAVGHLARRFAGSLRPGGPSAEDESWARSQLTAGERHLWARMAPADRRHGAGVARRVAAALGAGADRAVLAAALLHDVGKVEAGLGTLGRVAATVAGALGGRARARSWSRGRGVRRRVGCYLRHAEVGAELLGAAGSDPLTVAWTRQHHLPPPRWSVPPVLGRALKGADDG